MATTAERSLAAEVRAVEEGHRAIAQDDGSIRVVSDTHHGKAYRVTFEAERVGWPIRYTCHPEGDQAGRDDHGDLTGPSGATPCKHTALAARRLEREGLARWDPDHGWVATDAAVIPAPAPTRTVDDIFAAVAKANAYQAQF